MRKQLEKIMLVVQIVVGLLTILISLLVATTLREGVGFFDNIATNVILALLVIFFVLSSIYLLLSNFAHIGKVKRLTLYQQKDTYTKTTAKVVERLIKECVVLSKDVRVNKIKIIETDTGIVLRLSVAVAHDNVSHSIGQFRQSIEKMFLEVFAINLESIDFLVTKLGKRRLTQKENVQQSDVQDNVAVDNDDNLAENQQGESVSSSDGQNKVDEQPSDSQQTQSSGSKDEQLESDDNFATPQEADTVPVEKDNNTNIDIDNVEDTDIDTTVQDSTKE